MPPSDQVAIRAEDVDVDRLDDSAPEQIPRDAPRPPSNVGRGGCLAHLMERLLLSPTLALPLDAIAQTFAVIAPRGGAKTHAATVLVEEMVADRLPIVVIDLRGIWHALRQSTDGRAEGLPLHILGGEHGRSELREHAGGFVADWAVDWGKPLLLDLSSLSKGGASRFVADFADQVRFRAPRAMHVVLDDADTLLDGAGRGASVIDLVQSASTSGIGVTLVSHRASLLNIVPGVEVLIAARSKEPSEQASIRQWVARRSGLVLARRVAASVGSLASDEVWLCSPKWLGLVDRIRLRHRATYDGSKRGLGGLRPPQSLAAATELQRLRARLGDGAPFDLTGGVSSSPRGAVAIGRTPKKRAAVRLPDQPVPTGDLPSLRVHRQSKPLDKERRQSTRGRPIERLELRLEEKLALQRYARQSISAELALRARIVLACAEGRLIGEVARDLDVSPHTVGKWRRRFVEQQLYPLCACFGHVPLSEPRSLVHDITCVPIPTTQ